MTATIPEQRNETRTGKPQICDRPGCERQAVWLAILTCGCTAVSCDPCKEDASPQCAEKVLLYMMGIIACAFCHERQTAPPTWERLR